MAPILSYVSENLLLEANSENLLQKVWFLSEQYGQPGRVSYLAKDGSVSWPRDETMTDIKADIWACKRKHDLAKPFLADTLHRIISLAEACHLPDSQIKVLCTIPGLFSMYRNLGMRSLFKQCV